MVTRRKSRYRRLAASAWAPPASRAPAAIGKARQARDVFDAKADAFAVLAAARFDAAKAQIARDVPSWFHPGRSGAIKLGPKAILGYFGELHPDVLEAFDLTGGVAMFEVFLNAIPEARRKTTAKPPLDASDLQPVRRDFAFLAGADVAAADVVKAARAADDKLVSSVSVFDLFEGGNVAAGKKSLAIEVTLQPRERTLTDQEIEAVSAKIIERVRQTTGAEIRG